MPTIDPAIAQLASIVLALIFGASGAMKLRDVEMFEGSVANYQLLPRWIEKPFARALPLAELASAAGILFHATRTPAAVALTLLLWMFTGAIAINLARGRTNIDCGCFGPALRQELSGWLLLRNAFLMVLAGAAMLPQRARAMVWLDGVTIALSAATLIILYASANFAVGNAPKTRALKAL